MKQPKEILYRQGDVMFRLVDSIPPGATKRESGIIAYGEATGHTHALADLKAAEVLEFDGKLFVQVGEAGVSIRHQEHGPIDLPPGLYDVSIQQEYSPEEIRSVVD